VEKINKHVTGAQIFEPHCKTNSQTLLCEMIKNVRTG